MSTDALLTLLALLFAVLAVLPPERLLDLRLRFGIFDWVIAIAAFLLIHYIKFFPTLNSLGVSSLGPWRWGLDADTASYLVILVAALIVIIRVGTAGVHPRKIGVFQTLGERLLFAGRYAELLFLLERHLPAIRRLIEGRNLATRIRLWLDPPAALEIRWMIEAGKRETLSGRSSTQKAIRGYIGSRVARGFPDHETRQRQAGRLFERVFLSEPFVTYLAKAQPYFGLRVLEVEKAFFSEPFLKLFLNCLLNDRHSVLYEEVLKNQGQSPGMVFRYEIDPLNPVIYYLFGGDEFRAEELKLYKPLGDSITERIENLRFDPASDRYRKPNRDYTDHDKRSCPIFIGLTLFDFLITEGLHRGIRWHLWLMYLEYCTAAIVNNMADLGEDVDLSREYPTPYHYLLYEIFVIHTRWLETAARLSDQSSLASVEVKNQKLDYDSIAKSAALCLAICLRKVCESQNLHPEFKSYLLGVILHGYSQVAEAQHPSLTRFMELAILAGAHWGSTVDRSAYHRALNEALDTDQLSSHYMTPAEHLIELIRDTQKLAAGN